MWRCIAGQVVSDVSSESFTFFFRVSLYFEGSKFPGLKPLKRKVTYFFDTSPSTYQAEQPPIPEDRNSRLYSIKTPEVEQFFL